MSAHTYYGYIRGGASVASGAMTVYALRRIDVRIEADDEEGYFTESIVLGHYGHGQTEDEAKSDLLINLGGVLDILNEYADKGHQPSAAEAELWRTFIEVKIGGAE